MRGSKTDQSQSADPKVPTHRPPWNANGLPAGATQR